MPENSSPGHTQSPLSLLHVPLGSLSCLELQVASSTHVNSVQGLHKVSILKAIFIKIDNGYVYILSQASSLQNSLHLQAPVGKHSPLSVQLVELAPGVGVPQLNFSV